MRSGKVFSSWNAPAVSLIQSPCGFDLEALIRDSTALEDNITMEEEQEDLPPPPPKRHCSPSSSETPPSEKRQWTDSELDAHTPTSFRHKKRREKREMKALKTGQAPKEQTIAKVVQDALSITTSLSTEGLPSNRGAYSATNATYEGAQRVRTVKEMVDQEGFTYVPWNGRYTLYSY